MRAGTRPALLVAAVLALVLARAASAQVPGAAWLLDQVKALSAPEMEGRRSGTAGADRAARHIGGVFQQAGLRPGGDGGTYLQAFHVPTGIRLGQKNELSLVAPGRRALVLGTDFSPLAVSTDAEVEGDVVFVGYGITAADLGYDDYAGVDARGKVVLALTGEPRGDDPASPFRRPEAYHYSERSHKIINAREHGARAILLAPHPASRDALPALGGISQPSGIVAVAVTRATADTLLGPTGERVADLATTIDRSLAPRSQIPAGARVRLRVELVRERAATANVIGILPGTDARLKDDALVVGAHYDHLGRGGEGSLAPDALGVVHPGADDNASGTATVMALARAFAAAGGAPRTLVFVAFAGEELGILGSTHYVRKPAFPLDRTILMVNLDMVGRLRNGRLYVGGVDSGSGLRAAVAEAAKGLPLTLELRGDPFASSDHSAFYPAGRPVLFLFTGAHGDYHRPSDTWDKVNAAGLETVAAFTMRLVAAVAAEQVPPVYARLAAPAREVRGAYGPFFGVIPDFTEAERPGVRIGGVRPGSPADKAGVRGGDLLVRFGKVTIATLNDLTFALRGHRAGDRVEVVVLRDGQERKLEAVLEERRQ